MIWVETWRLPLNLPGFLHILRFKDKDTTFWPFYFHKLSTGSRAFWNSFKMFWSVLKVSKFQNENLKSSHCPKFERKIWKILSWILRTEFFKFFRSDFGKCDDFIFCFWDLLTFSLSKAKKMNKITVHQLFYLKVSKFQKENMKSSHFPKSERKNLKNSVLNT